MYETFLYSQACFMFSIVCDDDLVDFPSTRGPSSPHSYLFDLTGMVLLAPVVGNSEGCLLARAYMNDCHWLCSAHLQLAYSTPPLLDENQFTGQLTTTATARDSTHRSRSFLITRAFLINSASFRRLPTKE